MTSTSQSPAPAFAAFLGIDRGHRTHDWVELAPDGSIRARGALPNRPEKIEPWLRERLAAVEGPLAIAMEQPAAALMHLLRGFKNVHVFGLNPGSVAAYRHSLKPSRTKSDALDAEVIARLLLERHGHLEAFAPDSPATRKVALLVQQRRSLVDLRTKLSNQLIARLMDYYPQALELCGDRLFAPLAIAFLRRWPSFQALKRSRPQTVRDFYHAHGCVRQSALEKRLALLTTARPITDDDAILMTGELMMRALLDQLETLQKSIECHEAELHEAFGQNPDAFIFESLPGSGRIHCARLLAAFGDRRERFPTADAIQSFSGIAPILHSSGHRPKPLTIRRRACPVFVKQSIHEWAAESARRCSWAKAYYQQQRAKGHRHHTAVRALAYKWLRIIHVMWLNRTRYNDQQYLKALRQKGSPLIALIDQQDSEKIPQSA